MKLLNRRPIFTVRTRTFMTMAALVLSISSITAAAFAALPGTLAMDSSSASADQTSSQSTADQKPDEKKEVPFKVGNGVTPPRPISTPDPEFPITRSKEKLNGTVELSVVIDKGGRVQGIRVVKSLGPAFDEHAINTVQKWLFEPAQKDGKPVSVEIRIEVNFKRT